MKDTRSNICGEATERAKEENAINWKVYIRSASVLLQGTPKIHVKRFTEPKDVQRERKHRDISCDYPSTFWKGNPCFIASQLLVGLVPVYKIIMIKGYIGSI